MALEINNIDLYLGKKLRFFRKKMNWPLKTLASKLGISVQQLQRYEISLNKISASLLYDMAKAFQIKVEDFFEGFENEVTQDQKQALSSNLNILLVEDDVNDEFLLRRALSDYPFTLNIFTLHDGDSVLSFFRSVNTQEDVTPLPKPDLIFLDLNVPSVRGLDLLKDVKKRKVLQDIPVIVLTNSLNPDDMYESYHLQASGFIRKSFNFDEFKEQLHHTLNYWAKTVVLPH